MGGDRETKSTVKGPNRRPKTVSSGASRGGREVHQASVARCTGKVILGVMIELDKINPNHLPLKLFKFYNVFNPVPLCT